MLDKKLLVIVVVAACMAVATPKADKDRRFFSGCFYRGYFYSVGKRFPAKDGCNTCTCVAPYRIACTEKACPRRCKVNGVYYDVGETFPAPDGCNVCKCSSNGKIACTKKACVSCPVKGQVFTECGLDCPPNCTIPIPVCNKLCVRRCECPKGQVIDELSNTCVRISECPTHCPPDKPPVNCFVNPCRFAKCRAHPYAKCRADFCGGCNARFFDSKGNEVTDSCDCPVKGQLFTTCGSACPANCTTPNPICTKQCVARCECPRKTVINERKNMCTTIKKCPKRKKCPPTQIFNDCGSACTPTCKKPDIVCTLQCVPRCECPKGKIFNQKTKRCIPPSKC